MNSIYKRKFTPTKINNFNNFNTHFSSNTPKVDQKKYLGECMNKVNLKLGHKGVKTNYDLDHAYKRHYYQMKWDPHDFKLKNGQSTTIQLKQWSIPGRKHFRSEFMDQYKSYPDAKQQFPLKTRQQLMESTMTVGQKGRKYFKQTYVEHFNDNLKLKPKSITFKKKPNRYHLITGKQILKNDVYRASAFDAFKENHNALRRSRDYSPIPQPGKRFCLVTGRPINY